MSNQNNEVTSRVDNSAAILRRLQDREQAVVEDAAPPIPQLEKPKVSRALEPFGDRVLILQKPPEEFYEHGVLKLVKTEDSKERPNEGTVVAFGPGRYLANGQFLPTSVKQGNIVIFGKYAGTEQELNGTIYLIVREDEILGKIVETPI